MSFVGERVIYGPLRDQLGLSRVHAAFTGGEAIGDETFLYYRAIGIDLRQMYGQTESGAIIAIHAANENSLHTVGRPAPGVDISIADDGEILMKSGSIFAGYYKNQKATDETLVDGWMHSGDAGYLEEDGHLVVLGRLGDVVYTAEGERFIPTYIENRLKFSHFVKEAAVFGAGKDYLSAMICIDAEAVGHWAENNGIPYVSYADLSQKPEVVAEVRKSIVELNQVLPEKLCIKKFVNLHKSFDADDGEITRTGKLRRKIIAEHYQVVFDALYSDVSDVMMKATLTYDTGETGVIERNLSVETL